MLTTSDGSIKVNDLVLITGAGETPVQGVVESVESERIAKVRTSAGTQTTFISGLRVINGGEKS